MVQLLGLVELSVILVGGIGGEARSLSSLTLPITGGVLFRAMCAKEGSFRDP